MAGNKRRAARPEGITGAAAARVPARYDAAPVRGARSAQRSGGSKKRKTGTGSRSASGSGSPSEGSRSVRGQGRSASQSRTVQRTSRNSRYEQDERRRPSGRSPQDQRVQRESRQGQGQRMQQGSRTQAARAAYEYGNQKQAYEAGAVPKKKKERSFYDLSLVVIIIVLTVFGLVMIYSASSYTAQLNDDLNNNSAYFMQRQGGIALGGFIFMLIISKMDYHWLYRLAVPSYILSHKIGRAHV